MRFFRCRMLKIAAEKMFEGVFESHNFPFGDFIFTCKSCSDQSFTTLVISNLFFVSLVLDKNISQYIKRSQQDARLALGVVYCHRKRPTCATWITNVTQGHIYWWQFFFLSHTFASCRFAASSFSQSATSAYLLEAVMLNFSGKSRFFAVVIAGETKYYLSLSHRALFC